MIDRFVSGELHPFIHTGQGYELICLELSRKVRLHMKRRKYKPHFHGAITAAV